MREVISAEDVRARLDAVAIREEEVPASENVVVRPRVALRHGAYVA